MGLTPTITGGRDFRLEWNRATFRAIEKIGPKAIGKIADSARDHIKARAPVAARHRDARGVKGPLKQSIESRMRRNRNKAVTGAIVMMHYYGYFLHGGTKRGIEPHNFVERGVAAMASEIDDILRDSF